MMLEVAIETDAEWDSSDGRHGDWKQLVQQAAEAAIAESAFPQLLTGTRPVEIAVRLTSDEEVRALNAQWRGKDKATNVLSFPLAEATELHAANVAEQELLLGDIVLGRQVCAREAADKGVPLDHHAAHLVAHGTLHLLGHDHHDDASAADMESREIRALARLGIADPYGEQG